MLQHDTQIAWAVRIMGWAGMLATTGWMVYRSLRPGNEPLNVRVDEPHEAANRDQWMT